MLKATTQGRYRLIKRIEIPTNDELGNLARVFQHLVLDLETKNEREVKYRSEQEERTWVGEQVSKMTALIEQKQGMNSMLQHFIREFSEPVGAVFSAIYVREKTQNGDVLKLKGSYALKGELAPVEVFDLGEGPVGQCALDGKQKQIMDLPEHFQIRTGSGSGKVGAILLQPIRFHQTVVGVIEWAGLQKFNESKVQLNERLAERLGR